MACPFFFPPQRRDDLLWPHPARLPLGAGFGGTCHAQADNAASPGDAALRDFAGLPRVSIESAETAAIALDWAERGMDFAYALHLATTRAHDGFVTFDRTLVRIARRLGAPPVREP